MNSPSVVKREESVLQQTIQTTTADLVKVVWWKKSQAGDSCDMLHKWSLHTNYE